MSPVINKEQQPGGFSHGTVRPVRPAADALPLVEELGPAPAAFEAFYRLAVLPHVVFFDSALAHPRLGRYSFVAADPFLWISARGTCVRVRGEAQARQPADPFAVLAECLGRFRAEPVAGLPPFQGGAAGLFGYDLCHHIERLPRPAHDEFETPDLGIGLYDWVLAFDHGQNRAWLVSTGFPESGTGQRRHAARRAAEVKRRLRAPPQAPRPLEADSPVQPAAAWPVPGFERLASSFRREEYLATARRAVEYIHAGDCFQVNLSQRLLWPAEESPIELYRRLRACNPAPFGGYLDLGTFAVASASPERFLWVEGERVETYPIKGTRPRGRTPDEDRALVQELLASPKDRAENVMIVDLLRNDLGRVCRYGSVEVAAVCRLESYPFVHHLVSEVHGRLRLGQGPIDLLRAAFPGGSVTGAPKVRAMEIIAELEPTARGPYCGSLGYIGFDGSTDTNILIRSLTIGRGWAQFPVGGGIVADSVPEQEYEETWHKAAGMLRAVEAP
jgi:para-aminobenzoate synthetase component 1